MKTTIRHWSAAATLGFALAGAPAGAEDGNLLLWTDQSATLLHGYGFALPGDSVTTLTIEHASGWTFGDLFAFTDLQALHDNPAQDTTWYYEVSPRISLGKVAGLSFGDGAFVKDVLIASTFERGEGGIEALLLGIGTDLDVPGFNFVKLNAYARKDTGLGAGFEDMHWTLSWSRSFDVGSQSFVVDGFIDYVVGWGPQAGNVHIVPQIKWDIGKNFGARPGQVLFGTEIDYWENQFGVQSGPGLDSDQFAVNAILKVHF